MGTMQVWEEIRLQPESGARALVEAYSERLYKLAYRLCSNSATAEDLAIRTISRAVRASGEFASEASYFSFLCSILVNLYRDDLRLKGAKSLVFVEDVPEVHDEVPNPAETLIAKSDAAEVRAAVATLSPLLRETVVLRYYSGLSVSEVAETLSVPDGTVKFRLSEARRKIREFLTKRDSGFARCAC